MRLEYGIVANVVDDRALRTGAKVWLCLWTGGSMDRPLVRGVSKGGRTITKRINAKRLTNFRAAWIPPTRAEDVSMAWPRAEASAMAEQLAARFDREFPKGKPEFPKDGAPNARK